MRSPQRESSGNVHHLNIWLLKVFETSAVQEREGSV